MTFVYIKLFGLKRVNVKETKNVNYNVLLFVMGYNLKRSCSVQFVNEITLEFE